MTIDQIKSAICSYFNKSANFKVPFIKSPTEKAAPKGTYIAVKVDGVSQHGSMMVPNKGEGYHFSKVASVVFIEVEGDGDVLRHVQNELQMPSFVEHAANAGFSVWELGQIIEAPSYDGEFYVRQWRMTVRMNFCDEAVSNIPKIETADVSFDVI